jgi:hypothetical protein
MNWRERLFLGAWLSLCFALMTEGALWAGDCPSNSDDCAAVPDNGSTAAAIGGGLAGGGLAYNSYKKRKGGKGGKDSKGGKGGTGSKPSGYHDPEDPWTPPPDNWPDDWKHNYLDKQVDMGRHPKGPDALPPGIPHPPMDTRPTETPTPKPTPGPYETAGNAIKAYHKP